MGGPANPGDQGRLLCRSFSRGVSRMSQAKRGEHCRVTAWEESRWEGPEAREHMFEKLKEVERGWTLGPLIRFKWGRTRRKNKASFTCITFSSH